MATYRTLVNNVLATLGWNELTTGGFTSPDEPGRSIKRFINDAKDEILNEIDYNDLREEEFAFVCYTPEDETSSIGNIAVGSTSAKCSTRSPVSTSMRTVGSDSSTTKRVGNGSFR